MDPMHMVQGGENDSESDTDYEDYEGSDGPGGDPRERIPQLTPPLQSKNNSSGADEGGKRKKKGGTHGILYAGRCRKSTRRIYKKIKEV